MTRTAVLRPALLLVVLSLLAATLVAITAIRGDAADPGEGTVGPDVRSLTWDGAANTPVFPTGDNGETNACPPGSADPSNSVCDHFSLTVDVQESYWEADDVSGGVRIEIAFAEGDDWEVAVFRGDEDPVPVANVATANNPEVLFLPEAFGTYEVRVSPYLTPSGEGYTGTATFVTEDPTLAVDPLSPGFQAFTGTRVPSEGTPEADFTNATTRYDGRPVAYRQSLLPRDAAEPTIGVQSDGDMYYAAGTFDATPTGTGARTEIYRSSDRGDSWQDVSPTVAGENSQPASLDPYVYVSPYTDRVFSIDLTLANFNLFYTDDDGENWTPATGDASNSVQDHQTVFSGPVPPALEGLTNAEEIVYYCFNKIAEATCSRSLDGGQTFSRTGAPAFPGADAEGGFCGGLHGHIDVDNEGRLFLPKGHCNRPWLGISDDGGTTWDTVRVADMEFPEQQSSIAHDSEDNLYYAWYDTNGLPYLATSTDHGATWSKPIMVAPPGVGEVQWPTVYAGDPGRVALGFPCTRAVGEQAQLPNRPWDHCMVMSTTALDDNPTFVSNISNPVTDPVHRGECPGRCGNMFDFLDVTVELPSAGGRTLAAFVDTCTDQIFGPEDAPFPQCNIDPTAVGFDGTNDNASGDMDGLASIQTCGPSLWEAIGEITDDCQLDAVGDQGGVIVLGGDVAIADTVDAEIEALGVRRGRIEGEDRYETATRTARATFPTGSDTVYVATGLAFPDGLAGAPAAAAADAPVVLTATGTLPASTRSLLEDFAPAAVVVVGGPDAISNAVVAEIADAAGVEPSRVAGGTRYATAVEVSQATYPDGADTVLVATGEQFPDALSGAAAAARIDAPVLLTQQGNLPAETARELMRLDADRVVILGGETAVSAATEAQILAASGGADVERLFGETRYETAVAISSEFWPDGATPVYLATGEAFPDALSGAAAAARKDSPVLLTPRDALADVAADEIVRLVTRRVPATVR